jgi:hypothetical protein
MLTLLADGDVLFVIRLGFGTGNVAHGIYLPAIHNFLKRINLLKLFVLIIYTQYIGICQRIITICCVCFMGSEVQGSKVEDLNKD